MFEVVLHGRREPTDLLVSPPRTRKVDRSEIELPKHAHPLRGQHLPRRERRVGQGDAHRVHTEVPEGDRELEVVPTCALAAWELLAADLSCRRTGAQDEVLIAWPVVHDVLHSELPVGNCGNFVEEQVPRPVGVRMQLPGALNYVSDVGVCGREIEGEVQDAPLAALQELLDKALGGGRLADLARTTESVHTSQINLDRVEGGGIPVEAARRERSDLRITLDRGGIAPPGIEMKDLSVRNGHVLPCRFPKWTSEYRMSNQSAQRKTGTVPALSQP